MEPRLTLITLGVKNLDHSKKFYCQGLGWQPTAMSEEHIVFIDCGGLLLALFDREALAHDIGVDAYGSGFRGVTLAQNVSSKEEVVKTLIDAEQAGAKIIKPAQDVFWGGYSGYFADPDSYYWEIAWNPFLKL